MHALMLTIIATVSSYHGTAGHGFIAVLRGKKKVDELDENRMELFN